MYKKSEAEWELAQLYVDAPFQNLRIGSTVLADFLSEAQKANRSIMLSAFRVSPVVKLYKRFGFVIEEDDPAHYKFLMHWRPQF